MYGVLSEETKKTALSCHKARRVLSDWTAEAVRDAALQIRWPRDESTSHRAGCDSDRACAYVTFLLFCRSVPLWLDKSSELVITASLARDRIVLGVAS